MSTSPDSVSYPFQPYGVLGPYPWQTVNVQDFGATGDGVTDDGPRFQLALDAIPPEGGILIIPPAVSGRYLIGQCLRHPSFIVIRGSGAASILKGATDFTDSPDYGGTAIFLNNNSQSDETSFTGYRNFQITFDNVWFDNTERPAGDSHAIFHRAVQQVVINNCAFFGGGDATASVTCDDHLVDGCTAIGQTNCTYDHWGGSTNCRVVNSYAEVGADSVGQIVNFNGIRTGVGTGVDEVWHSSGFAMSNCDLFCTGAQKSLNLEPLGPNSTVANVRITNNRLSNVRIVMSNNTSAVQITSNIFTDTDGSTAPIWARTQFGADANLITVMGNQFIDCDSQSGSGLIDTTAPNTTVVGNTALGGVYEYGVRFRNNVGGVYLGNVIPDATLFEVLGAYGAGGDVQVNNERKLSILDEDGYPAFWQIDATKTLYLVGSSAALGQRALLSIAMQSSTSQLVVYPNLLLTGLIRETYAEGLTAAGSTAADPLALTGQNNVVATTAAGTGVRLPTPSGGGLEISVWNDGANTLNVYPPAGGQINGGGVNVPVTLAAGASGRWISTSAALYRTAP